MPAKRPQQPFDASRAARATANQSPPTLKHLPSRQLFSSPNPSVSTLQDSDGADNSELDEDAKPNLNVITNFAHPKMPMKGDDLAINQVRSQQAQARRQKAISVVSQKGVHLTMTPADDMPSLKNIISRTDLKGDAMQQRKPTATSENRSTDRDMSPQVQRIPIGITIPQRDAQALRDNLAIDSALALRTPITPSIVITPAKATTDWSFDQSKRPVSSIYSAAPYDSDPHSHQIPPVPHLPSYAQSMMDTCHDDGQVMGSKGPRISTESLAPILPVDSQISRPKSQGWWNVVLSPLLRNASVASKQAKTQESTPPIPRFPFSGSKMRSSPTSAHSDPKSAASTESHLSPDTPRRTGMATTRESTWSRWTEPEPQQDVDDGLAKTLDKSKLRMDDKEAPTVTPKEPTYTSRTHNNNGLAAEYFLACAVERATGQPYFECLHHSCAEQLPVLKSIYDGEGFNRHQVASLGVEPLASQTTITGEENVGHGNALSEPRLTRNQELSPNELSPNVRQADVAAVFKAREVHSTRSSPEIGGSITKAEPSNQVLHSSSKPRELGTFVTVRDISKKSPDLPEVGTKSPEEKASSGNASTHAKISKLAKLKRSSSPAVAPLQPSTEKDMSYANLPPVASPGPLSPEAQKSLALAEAVPMSRFESLSPPQQQLPISDKAVESPAMPERSAFVTHDTSYPDMPAQPPTAVVTARDIREDDRFDRSIEKKRQRHEQEEAVGRKVGGLWRGRGCVPKEGCFGRQGREGRLRRRWIAAISAMLVAIIVTCIVLAITLTRKGDNTPVQSQWLNLTGFPPIPTGISTIAVPNLQSFENQCVSPTTMWSCAVPRDSQEELNGNDPTQPNFRFEISFNNNTAGVPSNETIPLNGTGKSSGKTATDPFTNDLFTPNPSPPSTAEQIFLGNTTDNITQPFNGDTTPFFITLLAAWPTLPAAFNSSIEKRSDLARRQSNDTSSVGNSIPAPSTNPDGTATNATLLPNDPYPFSQPLRLYNRGQADEHYGFYMSYDKSIFLSGFDLNDTSSDDTSNNDQNGGSTLAQATSVCTFSQTRYLIKFFTNPRFGGSLLATPPPIDGESDPSSSEKSKNNTTSATDFTRPGSFPYPASIVLDRHGGDESKKGVYCYGLEDGVVQKDVKIAVGEFITAGGGTAINPAPALTGSSSSVDKSLGGIDGGTGGCQCTYQNWQ